MKKLFDTMVYIKDLLKHYSGVQNRVKIFWWYEPELTIRDTKKIKIISDALIESNWQLDYVRPFFGVNTTTNKNIETVELHLVYVGADYTTTQVTTPKKRKKPRPRFFGRRFKRSVKNNRKRIEKAITCDRANRRKNKQRIQAQSLQDS